MRSKKPYVALAIICLIVVIGAVGYWVNKYEQLRGSERVLRQDLHTMRDLIETYAVDNEQLPQTLDDLVRKAYMSEIPIDPLTLKRDWKIKIGEDRGIPSRGRGIINVYSNATGDSSDGVKYSEY